MNTFKRLFIFALLLGIAFVVKAQAGGYVTFASTSVAITTSTDMELLSIEISSGNGVQGDAYVILVDTAPIGYTTFTAVTQLPSGSGDFTMARYPVTQWVTPPIVAVTTNTTGVNPNVKVSFVDSQGNGRRLENGLAVFNLKNGNGTGQIMAVTVEYRKRTSRTGR